MSRDRTVAARLLLLLYGAAAASAAADGPAAADGAALPVQGIDMETEFHWLRKALEAAGLQRLKLLKAIEVKSYDLFEQHPAFASGRAVLGDTGDARARLQDAVVRQIWVGACAPLERDGGVGEMEASACEVHGRRRSGAACAAPSLAPAAPAATTFFFFVLWPRRRSTLPSRPSTPTLPGIPDQSPEWYAVLNVSQSVQAVRTQLVRMALQRMDTGFTVGAWRVGGWWTVRGCSVGWAKEVPRAKCAPSCRAACWAVRAAWRRSACGPRPSALGRPPLAAARGDNTTFHRSARLPAPPTLLAQQDLEAALVEGSSRVVDAYQGYYDAWIRAVQARCLRRCLLHRCQLCMLHGMAEGTRQCRGPLRTLVPACPPGARPRMLLQSNESRALAAALQAAGPVPPELLTDGARYTVLTGTGPDDVEAVPYAVYFEDALAPVLEAMDAWIECEFCLGWLARRHGLPACLPACPLHDSPTHMAQHSRFRTPACLPARLHACTPGQRPLTRLAHPFSCLPLQWWPPPPPTTPTGRPSRWVLDVDQPENQACSVSSACAPHGVLCSPAWAGSAGRLQAGRGAPARSSGRFHTMLTRHHHHQPLMPARWPICQKHRHRPSLMPVTNIIIAHV